MVSLATSKQILEQFLPTLVHFSITFSTHWLEKSVFVATWTDEAWSEEEIKVTQTEFFNQQVQGWRNSSHDLDHLISISPMFSNEAVPGLTGKQTPL